MAWRTLLDAAISELPSECKHDRQRAAQFEISSDHIYFPFSAAPAAPRARQASGRAFAFAAGAIPLFGGQLRRTQPALREVSAVPPPSCGKLDHSMFDLLLIHPGY